MKQIRCNGCREWFDAAHFICPECEEPRPGFNSWLATAKLNNHLYQMAEDSKPRNKYESEYRRYKGELDRMAREL